MVLKLSINKDLYLYPLVMLSLLYLPITARMTKQSKGNTMQYFPTDSLMTSRSHSWKLSPSPSLTQRMLYST